MPKDIHVEPERFAAELICRLETVLREREAQERLEERLKRVRLVSVWAELQLIMVIYTMVPLWAHLCALYTNIHFLSL